MNISIVYIQRVNNIKATNVGTYPKYPYTLQKSSFFRLIVWMSLELHDISSFAFRIILYLLSTFANGQSFAATFSGS